MPAVLPDLTAMFDAEPALDEPYVIARAHTTLLGLPSSWASEMFVCPEVSPLPMAPPYVRGIAIRRNRTVRLVDARVRLDCGSRKAETDGILQLLHQREADHVRWVDTLLECISTGAAFTLARDPHSCAFGQWYDSYVPPTMTLRYQLAKFAEPHAEIHALAGQAEALVESKGRAAAIELIEHHRSYTLDRMRALFGETRTLVQDDVREIIVVHENGRQLMGLVVDDIVSVERLRRESLTTLEGQVPGGSDPLVRFSARNARDEVVLLPDLYELMGALHDT